MEKTFPCAWDNHLKCALRLNSDTLIVPYWRDTWISENGSVIFRLLGSWECTHQPEKAVALPVRTGCDINATITVLCAWRGPLGVLWRPHLLTPFIRPSGVQASTGATCKQTASRGRTYRWACARWWNAGSWGRTERRARGSVGSSRSLSLSGSIPWSSPAQMWCYLGTGGRNISRVL